jgi:AraC family transcriptional regulator
MTVGENTAANCVDLCGRLTFIPQNARVSGWSDLSGDDQGYAALFFDPALVEAEYERPILGMAVRPLVYFEDDLLCRTLRRLEALVTAGDEPEPVAAETLGLLAVLQLYPRLGGAFEQDAGQLSLPQQRALADFVEARIGSAISLSELAAIAGLSRYHFARSFSRTYGRAPHQYILLRRISLAASLLTSSTLPVSEIALRVGFSSPARLSIAFRRIVGCSPRFFRQAAR